MNANLDMGDLQVLRVCQDWSRKNPTAEMFAGSWIKSECERQRVPFHQAQLSKLVRAGLLVKEDSSRGGNRRQPPGKPLSRRPPTSWADVTNPARKRTWPKDGLRPDLPAPEEGGGIDGVIKEDKLGLDVVCVQAKRWEGFGWETGGPGVRGQHGLYPSQEGRHTDHFSVYEGCP